MTIRKYSEINHVTTGHLMERIIYDISEYQIRVNTKSHSEYKYNDVDSNLSILELFI